MELLFIFLLIAISWFNYKYFGRLLVPAVLFSFVWTGILILHGILSATLLKDLYPLSIKALLIFTGGVIAFTAGGLLFKLYQNSDAPVRIERNMPAGFPPISFQLRLLLVIICAIALPFFIQTVLAIFIQSQVDNFLVGLRYELTFGEADLGPLKYMITFSIIVFAVCQMEAVRNPILKNKLLAISSFLIAFTFAIFSTGRTFFMLLGMLYFGLHFIYNKRFRIRKLLWLVPLAALLFTGYGLLFGKGGDIDATISENVSSSSENTGIYLVGSLNAFDWEINHQYHPAFNGYNSLRFIYVVGISAGLLAPVKFDDNLLQDYVLIPYATNVYTFYSPYVKDFGYIYPIIILMLVGLLHTWLYERATSTGSPRYALYYSLLLYPLVMSFFQDQYFTLLSTWLQSIIIIEAIFFINKFFLKKSLTLFNLPPSIEPVTV